MATRDDTFRTRRRLLKSAGGLIAAAAPSLSASATQAAPLSASATPAQTASPAAARAGDVTARLARYMVEARDRALPADAAREARHRILDTVAAIVSGSHLPPGEAAIRFIQTQGGKEEAS